jgi:hypothetical protein
MSGQLSSFYENQVLAELFNAAAALSLAHVFLALFTTNPTGGSGGTEATGGNYSRLSVATDNTHWTVTNNSVTNAVDLVMFTANGAVSSSANIVGFGLYDASTSGHLLMWAPVATPAAITTSGQIPTFPAGSLVVTLT